MSTAFLFNNKMMKYGTHAMGISSSPTPPAPVLPANTVRVRTSDGNAPVKSSDATYETATLVEGTNDVYDVYKSGTSFGDLLYKCTNITEVLGANLTGITRTSSMFNQCSSLTAVSLSNTSSVTNMNYMFSGCTSLTTVSLFDTSSVTRMEDMFKSCTSLTSIPLFDTSSVESMKEMFMNCTALQSVPLLDTSKVTGMTNMLYNCSLLTSIPLFDTSSVTGMSYMCYGCVNVESGALALYQQASSKTSVPKHNATFYHCGSNTTTGAAELAQIPNDWKST